MSPTHEKTHLKTAEEALKELFTHLLKLLAVSTEKQKALSDTMTEFVLRRCIILYKERQGNDATTTVQEQKLLSYILVASREVIETVLKPMQQELSQKEIATLLKHLRKQLFFPSSLPLQEENV